MSEDLYHTDIVKLHSDLQILLNVLVGVGVEFVFPCHKNKKNKNPHLTFTRREGPTCLEDVWKVSGGHKEGLRKMSGRCEEG